MIFKFWKLGSNYKWLWIPPSYINRKWVQFNSSSSSEPASAETSMSFMALSQMFSLKTAMIRLWLLMDNFSTVLLLLPTDWKFIRIQALVLISSKLLIFPPMYKPFAILRVAAIFKWPQPKKSTYTSSHMMEPMSGHTPLMQYLEFNFFLAGMVYLLHHCPTEKLKFIREKIMS